jgi:hypothetical protein
MESHKMDKVKEENQLITLKVMEVLMDREVIRFRCSLVILINRIMKSRISRMHRDCLDKMVRTKRTESNRQMKKKVKKNRAKRNISTTKTITKVKKINHKSQTTIT